MAKRKPTKSPLTPAVGYLRRSTSKQEISLKDQARHHGLSSSSHTLPGVRDNRLCRFGKAVPANRCK